MYIYIFIIFIFVYFLKRKFSEDVLQNAPNCTINKNSGKYAPRPLNIVRSYTISMIFLFFVTKLKQNILQNIPNCTIFKNILGKHAPKSPYTHISKINLDTPPPPS